MITNTPTFAGLPPKNCRKCPRLVEYRRDNRKNNPSWENGAIPPWGPSTAKLLIIGLAPGLKGANRTGRVFTGDGAGDFLFHHLDKAGLTKGTYCDDGQDDLFSHDIAITNAVACVPPQNRPTTQELNTCLPFLRRQINSMPNLVAIVCLGHLAHNACLRMLDQPQRKNPFKHGALHALPSKKHNRNLAIFDSYHCSRYNIQTKRLTSAMFQDVLSTLISYIDAHG